MTKVRIFGRSRFKFAKLFPEATFEGYECNIKYAYFSFKGEMDTQKFKETCDSNKIKFVIE